MGEQVMPMTIEQMATAVFRHRRDTRDSKSGGRGTAFQAELLAKKWLESTDWFRKQYPKATQQQQVIAQVANTMRSQMAQKAATTRKKNKERAAKQKLKDEESAAIAAEAAKQQSFDF